ncbi:sodium-dependent transporter [Pelagibaculum spongiae]|uniref:Sodium-dependent transporter n=1 Tax=Pelagibaculum spongiae TaxID=2080658 RepID=A0A2V1H3J4_9GAMM|nr:sodium-dependent transporter [Pelagibaculum spongiae]PVZ70589.1 sodium-dependent transporter [Pelagibaculum spongiae]
MHNAQSDIASPSSSNEERQGFSSRIGFILAAAGSAIGLGNIWGFPTQAAQNGGGAFLLIYLIMVFILAYPMLVAELTIGRLSQKNPIAALRNLSDNPTAKNFASLSGILGVCALSLILSFYAIVAGWLVSFMLEPIFSLLGMNAIADWLTGFSTSRNLVMMLVIMLLTIRVVQDGVSAGIERWSKRLMPALLILLVLLSVYILCQPGAMEGLELYLIPNFSQINADLMVSAMGQAFFSLSLGVTGMMVYGSYLAKKENLPATAAMVAGLDTFVAILAGLLIIPAMFVAQKNGVTIYAEDGSLLSSDTLVFTVLPAMFNTMGSVGPFIAIGFFTLLTIAAITSTISMLESPVNMACEQFNQPRKKMSWLTGGVITLISTIIVFNFGSLFGLVITITTVYAQPALAMVFGLLLMWVLRRDRLLKELQQGNPEIESSLFWKIWPWYVKFICPVMILVVFFN